MAEVLMCEALPHMNEQQKLTVVALLCMKGKLNSTGTACVELLETSQILADNHSDEVSASLQPEYDEPQLSAEQVHQEKAPARCIDGRAVGVSIPSKELEQPPENSREILVEEVISPEAVERSAESTATENTPLADSWQSLQSTMSSVIENDQPQLSVPVICENVFSLLKHQLVGSPVLETELVKLGLYSSDDVTFLERDDVAGIAGHLKAIPKRKFIMLMDKLMAYQ
jgi:hypothetical protein